MRRDRNASAPGPDGFGYRDFEGHSALVALDHATPDVADHVARVMDALQLPNDTTVFGNGFGAFVCLELAIRHGARFGRLIVAEVLL